MKNFLFGAAYYEEYQPEDRLEKDMALMQDAGMNTIRIAESTWSVEEPRCGEFDFSHVTRVIEAAGRFGIGVIIGTPTYAVPKWLADLDPEILGRNKFGPRQNMDITNPTYRFYAERIIRELVSRTAGYPNVIGFQIDNETKHYGMNNARVQSGFRAWLRERFGSIEAVNEAFGLRHWSSSVASFDELPDPEGTVNGGYACAFEEYRRGLAAEFLLWQAAIVTEYKREDQFITHNLDYEWKFFGADGQQEGYSYGVQPGISHFDAAKALTLIGTDIYCPPCGELTGREIAFGGSLMRPLKRAPYLVLESQSQAFTGWLPYPGQLKLMTLAHLAAGACGQMYWPWASIHGGLETYWKGILSHDGEPGETYAEVREIGKLLEALVPELEEKARAPIAVIVSPESLHAMNRFPTDRRLCYNDVVNTLHQALYELNLDCDILYDRETDWSGYRLIVFPELYCAGDEMIERVRAYVAEGGHVFAGFRSFYADENARPRHRQQPYGLTDVFGMHYDRFTKNSRHLWMELLEAEEAEVLVRYDDPHWSRYAALTRHPFGEGWAWYLGCTATAEELKPVLAAAAQKAGIPRPKLHWPIVSTARGRLRFVLNFSDTAQRAACPAKGTDLLTCAAVSENETLLLPPWGAAVIRTEHEDE